jgi:hypothetical protein
MKISHRYYIDDQGNSQRMNYFDNWFKILSKERAKQDGVSVRTYLSKIKDQASFEAVLQDVFSLDGSLANYVSGFDSESFTLFYNRSIIQDIVDMNKEEEVAEEMPGPQREEAMDMSKEFYKKLDRETPISVEQVARQVEEFFKGAFVDKETGKTRRVVAKKDSVKVRGKDMIRYRDSKGRFVRKI